MTVYVRKDVRKAIEIQIFQEGLKLLLLSVAIKAHAVGWMGRSSVR